MDSWRSTEAGVPDAPPLLSDSPTAHAPAYRRDIDGLRAIAVTAVVLFHAIEWLVPSGFVGVDIFFVISGYLIGGIVYQGALERRFSFARFYARRTRRILPALICLVGCCVPVALVSFDAQELKEFGDQAAAALIGGSNFYFWKHTGYFATAADQEPLLMTWSLGVEEQFYLLFPVLMLLVAAATPRLRLLAMLAAVAGSFIVSIWLTDRAPGTAFYLLPARAWELGAGALLAMSHRDAPHSRGMRAAWGEPLAWLSAAGLVASLLIFDGSTPFPGAAALLPVICTVGLIQSRDSAFNRLVLGSRPFVAIGLISYSWYLWHWPLMAFARRAADGAPSDAQMLGIALIGLLLGAASWKWVEQPFRQASCSDGATLRRYGVALAIAAALPIAFSVGGGWPQRLPPEVAAIERIRAQGKGDCIAPYRSTAPLADATCYAPGATVALIGDSHAAALGPGLVRSAGRMGLGVARYTMSSCTPLPGFAPFIAYERRHPQDCDSFRRRAIAAIVADPAIRVVVVAAYWNNLAKLRIVRVDTGEEVPARLAVEAGLRDLTAQLQRAGKRVVLAGDVPEPGFSPTNRMMGEIMPGRRVVRALLGQGGTDNGTFPRPAHYGPGHITTALLKDHAERASVGFFDPEAQLCAGATCRHAAGSTPIFFDSHHLSAAGSRMLDWQPALSAGVP